MIFKNLIFMWPLRSHYDSLVHIRIFCFYDISKLCLFCNIVIYVSYNWCLVWTPVNALNLTRIVSSVFLTDAILKEPIPALVGHLILFRRKCVHQETLSSSSSFDSPHPIGDLVIWSNVLLIFLEIAIHLHLYTVCNMATLCKEFRQ